tara:strand:- start:9 stop:386 length:378 start_codon:yes stop_codon:yes gene_type:complete
MDLWYRLETLVRSWLDDGATVRQDDESWQELEAFLRGDDFASSSPRPRAHQSSGERPVPADVRQALADLELAPGATMDEIRGAYRRQLVLYHPDRHTGDRSRHETASEVTRRLTLAYRRLCDYYG